MKQKLILLSRWSFSIAFGIFVFAYLLFHYLAPGGTFTAVYQTVAAKPILTLLFAIWGVLFLFCGIMSRLIAHIFFGSEKPAELADSLPGEPETAASPVRQERRGRLRTSL